MNSLDGRLERRLIAVATALLGLFNVALAMLRAPLSGLGQFEDIVPVAAINGSRFVLVILGILLLAVVPALWSGKRVAWGIALACSIGSAVAHTLKNVDLWGSGASVLLAGALIGARPQFPARSDPPTAVRGVLMLATGLVFVFAYSTIGLYFLDREFTRAIPLAGAFRDSLRLLFIVPATEAEPSTEHGSWFVDSVRVAFLFVMVMGAWQLLQPVIHRAYAGRVEREGVRTLLERYGNSSLAYFALLPDKAYFFSKRGNAVLAYKVIGANAIVMGDPIGDELEFAALVGSFRERCELNGWAYAFHQAAPRYLDLYAEHGLKGLKIGEEGVVDVQRFTLAGHEMKHLRSSINRFQREGYRAEVLTPPHDETLMRRLRQISDEWLALGNRRERTFTLGYFSEGLLQECEIMVARSADGTVVGFANIIPSYNAPYGNFDMVRYGEEPREVSDFIYTSLIDHFRERGYVGMSLGLAPFSGRDERREKSPAERAMRLLYRRGSFLFRYRGLREFKEKFAPEWEPRYLVYSSDLQLPGIALAVARAGELGGDTRPHSSDEDDALDSGVVHVGVAQK